MEMRKLVTFIRHEPTLLYAISVLTENILILFHMFPTLHDLSFLFDLWNLRYRGHSNALFILLVSQFRPESYLFLSKQLSLCFKTLS